MTAAAQDNTTLFRARVKMLVKKQERLRTGVEQPPSQHGQHEEEKEEAKGSTKFTTHPRLTPHEASRASQDPSKKSKPLTPADQSHLPHHHKRKDHSKRSSNCSTYCEHARQIVRNITELRDLVLDKRREYIHSCDVVGSLGSIYGTNSSSTTTTTTDFTAAAVAAASSGYMSDADRRRFDSDSDLAVKQCSRLIQDLETQIKADRSLRNEDESKHLRAIVHMLNIYLKDVIRVVAQLRAVYLKKMQHVRRICRLASLVDMYEASIAVAKETEEAQERKLDQLKREVDARSRRYEDSVEAEEKENSGSPSASIDGWEDAVDTKQFPPSIIPAAPAATTGQEHGPTGARRRRTGGKSEEKMIGAANTTTKAKKTKAKKEQREQKESQSAKQPPIPHPPLEELQAGSGGSGGGGMRAAMGCTAESPATAQPTGGDQLFGVESLSREEQAQLVVENRELFSRFTHTNQEIVRIESAMVEIQRLQDVFAEKVTEQEHDIETIHTQTLETLDNLEVANEYIRQAIRNQASRRVICLFCLIVLTLTLLFLHWYNP